MAIKTIYREHLVVVSKRESNNLDDKKFRRYANERRKHTPSLDDFKFTRVTGNVIHILNK